MAPKSLRLARLAILVAFSSWLWRSGALNDVAPDLVIDNMLALGCALVLVLASLATVAMRLLLLVTGHGHASLGTAWVANVLSLGFNFVVPGRLSELLKPWYLLRAAGIPYSVGFSAVVMERAFDVLFLAAMAVMGVIAFGAPRPLVWLIFGAAALAGLLAMPVWTRAARVLMGRILPAWAQGWFASWLDGMDGVASRRYSPSVWLTSAAGWALSFSAVWVLLHLSLDGTLGAKHALAVFVATTAGLAVSVLPGGAGTFEGAAVLTLRSFGVPPAESLALAILLRLQQAVVPLTALAVALLHDRSLFGSIRMAAAADIHAGAAGESGVEDA